MLFSNDPIYLKESEYIIFLSFKLLTICYKALPNVLVNAGILILI